MDALRHAIVHLEFAPGTIVNESDLMARVRLGRTPVREAVARLELEGFLSVLPRKGIAIAPVTTRDLRELCELRIELEALGASLAAQRRTPAQVVALRRLFKPAPRLVARSDLERLLRLDRDFHTLLAECAHSAYLQETLSRLYANSLRYWFISFSRAGHLAEVLGEHEDILAAVAGGDAEAARAAMRYHVLRFQEKTLQSL